MLLFLIAYIIYIVYRSTEAMHMLQQNLYNENNRYLKWTRKNLKKVFCLIDFIPIVLFIFIFFTQDQSVIDSLLVAAMFIYVYGIYNEYKRNKDNQNKLPLKITGRIKRLFVTVILIIGVILYFTVVINKSGNQVNTAIMLIILSFTLAFIYYVTLLASIIDTPMNQLEYLYYYNKAKKKLGEHKNLKVVGITGSYGKTSSKNVVNEILSSKYITRATPKNYNTPYGLMITINNYLDKFDEVLIAEMGAYTRGRIKNLCDFVHPKYGILTIIGEAHLETFGTRENICKTKFELIESLPSDGLAILNRDDPYQVNYDLQNKVKTIWIGIDNKKADIYATNIKCTHSGMSFDCNYYGNKINLKTRLLGSHNVYNILAGVALGLAMGIEINDIKGSIASLKPVAHRLELKKLGNIYMLDDAYNSNPIGAESALEVLNSMPGTKVVVTPGMVELGREEKKKNYEFGKAIASKCDYCILVGKKKTEVIYKALMDSNFDKDNIFIINRVKDAYSIVDALKEDGKDIYALFENDLPDIYEE